jgi:hypothetical protein
MVKGDIKMTMTFKLTSMGMIQQAADTGNSFLDKYNQFSDFVVGKEFELVLKPIGLALRDGFVALVHLLNQYSVEIITVSVIACGLGMMVEGLFGKRFNCTGKLGMVLLGGVIWRMLI